MSCAIASPFMSSAPRPQTYPSCTTPENGSTVQYSGVASTTSIWLSRMRGRALPSPFRRAYRFALPACGSNTWASMPSRASTAFSQCAVWSSLPGGLVVLNRHILRQQGRRLTAHGTPLGVGAGHVRLEQPRRQEDRLRGRAEQAYLWRRSRAGRARAGDSQGQGEERNETQTTSEPKRGTANYEPAARWASPPPSYGS